MLHNIPKHKKTPAAARVCKQTTVTTLKRIWNHDFTGFDLLESILSVLFQLTEEGNFKLVSDKEQLRTESGEEEEKSFKVLQVPSCLVSQTVLHHVHKEQQWFKSPYALCTTSYLMCCLVKEFFMWFDSTDLSIIICLCMFIESILQPTEKKHRWAISCNCYTHVSEKMNTF